MVVLDKIEKHNKILGLVVGFEQHGHIFDNNVTGVQSGVALKVGVRPDRLKTTSDPIRRPGAILWSPSTPSPA